MDQSIVLTFFGFTLTSLGLFNALIFSKHNEMVRERRTQINRQISASERFLGFASEQRHRLLDQNQDFLRRYRNEKLRYIPSSINYSGLVSLFTFLTLWLLIYWGSQIYIEIDDNWVIIGQPVLFLIGISFLGHYIILFLKNINNYLDLFKLEKSKGELNFIEINGERILENPKEVRRSFSDLPDTFDVRVRVKGNFRNGFIDSQYLYRILQGVTDRLWIPDLISYLSPFYHDENRRLRNRPELDTGILQENVDEEIELGFSIRNFTPITGILLKPSERLERIIIDVYEDRWHLPNIEREKIESETLTIINIDRLT